MTKRFNKLAYVRMCAWDFRKVLMYKFHYNYDKNINGNNTRLLFTETDSLMNEIRTHPMFMKILVRIKKCLISNYLAKSK